MASKFDHLTTAVDDGEIVVFLVGMTFNKPWAVRQWWPAFVAMPRMLKELQASPELGLLSHELLLGRRGPTVVQYWRSFDQLESFARGKDHTHMPAWSAFYRSKAATSGAVGLWHETYVTGPGDREALYAHAPALGFAKAGEVQPVTPDRATARKRRAEQPAPTS